MTAKGHTQSENWIELLERVDIFQFCNDSSDVFVRSMACLLLMEIIDSIWFVLSRAAGKSLRSSVSLICGSVSSRELLFFFVARLVPFLSTSFRQFLSSFLLPTSNLSPSGRVHYVLPVFNNYFTSIFPRKCSWTFTLNFSIRYKIKFITLSVKFPDVFGRQP